MSTCKNMFLLVAALLSVQCVYAQELDRKDVRRGNRKFEDGEYKAAIVDYQKGLLRDSTSFAAAYNMANALYRMENMPEAKKLLDTLSSVADASGYASDYYYNLGNTALAGKQYQEAVDAYKKSLLENPDDIDAKENYIYARKKLEEQQNQDNQDNQDQNKDRQDKNENQDQNKDQQDKNENQDQNNNQNNNQDRNQDNNNQHQQSQQPKLSKQAAQQMLNAMLAKEKETQDKVKKEKAAVMQSKQKEKNW